MTGISSVDEKELKKFNKTNKEWWDLNGEFKALHEINPVRIEYIKSVIMQHFDIQTNSNKPLQNLKILDVGSGGGLVCKPMFELGGDITGLDANSYNTKAAATHASENQLDIKYINSTVEEYCVSNQKQFDVVLCLEVVEHVANPSEFVVNVSKLAKPGGVLIFSTINRTIKSFALAIIMAEYVLGWVPKKTHDHSKFIKPSEFVGMLKDTPFDLSELKGLSLSVPNKIWYLTDSVDVNYFAVFKSPSLKII
jgi:2-polyprenyl-6-hydroxyphenyl methylase / 3-demethylubiquinone-9 3-methyltransferase